MPGFTSKLPCHKMNKQCLYLARKYAGIFVHGHYLFQDANSFPKVKLEENWPWGTDNVRGKKYKHIFAQNWCRVSYPSNVLQHAWTWNIVYEKLPVWSLRCLFCVLWYKLYEQKISPFFCKNHKTFSHLELNFKRRLIVVDVRFENWGISLGWYSRISPSFSWGKFSHVLRLDQSHVSKNICWIMIPYILPKSIREKRGGLPALFT